MNKTNPMQRTGTIIVTGATQGIGKAIALAALREGKRVIAVGRSQEKLEALAEGVGDAAPGLVAEALDLRDARAFGARLATWIDTDPNIIGLVNAAGMLETGSLLHCDPESLRRVIDLNLISTLEITLPVARHMASRHAGSIVTLGSNSGTSARMGLGSYPASKAGIIHAMKCLGLELAEYDVRCNIVSPGSTNTEMQQHFQTTTGSREGVLKGDPKRYRLGIPLGRMAEVEDVCDLVLFLLSGRSRHITMENIVIDGGATLGAR
ncbi:SDR family oxidoreductase [Mesorhizobium sp. M0761]|uniref:SDR family NAD(P)-dependent oxidoreductase n=1 Tax=Mesorhizobium sp. M0761 TaxID=2956994 RepID=UPI00333C1372